MTQWRRFAIVPGGAFIFVVSGSSVNVRQGSNVLVFGGQAVCVYGCVCVYVWSDFWLLGWSDVLWRMLLSVVEWDEPRWGFGLEHYVETGYISPSFPSFCRLCIRPWCHLHLHFVPNSLLAPLSTTWLVFAEFTVIITTNGADFDTFDALNQKCYRRRW